MVVIAPDISMGDPVSAEALPRSTVETASVSSDTSLAHTTLDAATVRSTSLRELELGGIIDAYNQVTEKLKVSHERLAHEIGRLRGQLAQKNKELARRERLAALGEMAAGVAHEVRNPLGGILLCATMLEADLKCQPEPHRLARQITGAVRTLESIVGDILAYGGETAPRCRDVSIDELVDEVVELLRCKWEPIGCRLTLDLPEDRLHACVDAMQIQRAVLNVVSNAIDAAGIGGDGNGDGGWVRVAVYVEESAAVVRVSDSGTGVPDSVREKVFNPFFTTKDSGTGLGLAIVHRIVDSHGGRVWLDEGEAGGAVFTLELPIEQAISDIIEENA